MLSKNDSQLYGNYMAYNYQSSQLLLVSVIAVSPIFKTFELQNFGVFGLKNDFTDSLITVYIEKKSVNSFYIDPFKMALT